MSKEMMYQAWKNRGTNEIKYQPLLPSGESAWASIGGTIWSKEDNGLDPVLYSSEQAANQIAYNYLCTIWEPLKW